MSHRRARALLGASVVTALAATSACATTPALRGGGDGTRVIRVVAAENFWGSLAAQLGGDHVRVTNLVGNPNTDPHDYEPTTADGREISSADYVVTNGIGYDSWSDKLLAADPAPGRTVMKVGDLLGKKPGDNPHQWYSPQSVARVIDRITADYRRIDPADAAYFDARRTALETEALARYRQLADEIRSRYAGTPVGASESIVTPLAEDLGLTLLTPESFLDAMSEGTDPTAADKATVDRQIDNRQISVYILNSQNTTPDVTAQADAARAHGIPVASVTETPVPAGVPFQDWQTRELQDIENALKAATGR